MNVESLRQRQIASMPFANPFDPGTPEARRDALTALLLLVRTCECPQERRLYLVWGLLGHLSYEASLDEAFGTAPKLKRPRGRPSSPIRSAQQYTAARALAAAAGLGARGCSELISGVRHTPNSAAASVLQMIKKDFPRMPRSERAWRHMLRKAPRLGDGSYGD
jgi:hypothetical protein